MARIFVLGATGSIGTAVTRDLIAHGHRVTALSRSDASDAKLETAGAVPLRGDLRNPAAWSRSLTDHDAIIHAAATFSEDMAEVEDRVLSAMEDALKTASAPVRLVYTGGCWLYGATGDAVATEDRPFNPIPAFAWMVKNAHKLLRSSRFNAAIIHPAMVYHHAGGVFEDFIEAARAGAPIEIWGSLETRWPLVHRDDLASVYRILAETAEPSGHFNVSAETGVRVGDIAETINRHFGNRSKISVLPVSEAVATHGDWAEGPALDLQMASTRLQRLLGWEPTVRDYRHSDLFQ
ncbi:NAD-dependent epimerase/dehydratase family protein [Roseovarius pacificus]|uniref:NAD-dependent epimerase/dehydratase family protein n=1 Tax=Roseovarius pacificus TaxID=337701 RepID=UPI002A18D782|nr:NAD-dependent epimerase/dehydratase family protein [Roseovarius pacificus]